MAAACQVAETVIQWPVVSIATPTLPLRPRFMRGCFSAMHPDFHFHPRPEPVDDRHEAVHGEPPQLRMADAGEVCGCNPGAVVRGPHSQVFAIERLDDLGGQNRLELLRVRVSAPEVT